MRTVAATIALLISALCFLFDVMFVILLAIHAYGEIQFGGWGMLPAAVGDVEWWRWINAGSALVFGIVFLWAGMSLMPRRDSPD